MNRFRQRFEAVRTQVGMYISEPTYGSAAAWVAGYDTAAEGGVLVGFQEWLIPRVGEGSNLCWSALVLHLAFPRSENVYEELTEGGNQAFAIDFLFRTIAQFDDDRSKPEGLRRIYLEYERWLRTQEWYTPDSPGWLER